MPIIPVHGCKKKNDPMPCSAPLTTSRSRLNRDLMAKCGGVARRELQRYLEGHVQVKDSRQFQRHNPGGVGGGVVVGRQARSVRGWGKYVYKNI